MKIERGDLIFVAHRGLLPSLIRKATQCQYNHVEMVLNEKECVGAGFGGVKIGSIDEYKRLLSKKKLNFDVYEFDSLKVSDKQIEDILWYIKKQVGRPYDFFQFFCLALFLIMHLNRLIEPIDVRNAWLCSELIAEAAYAAGLEFQLGRVDPDNISPSDIAKSDLTLFKGHGTSF